MGIIQCGTGKDKNEILNIIEKSLNNKKTTLDKKIYEEYYILKDLFKPQKKPEKTNSKERENDNNFQIITKKNNFISVKKRMDRFIKWYFMSHPNQHPNLKNKMNSTSETKISSNNHIHSNINKEINLNCLSNINNNNNNSNLCKNQSVGNLKNLKNCNFRISPINDLNNNNNNKSNDSNKSMIDLNGYFVKCSDQTYFNNRMRLSNSNLNNNNNKNDNINNINNNEISPIACNKKVQFIPEKECDKANQILNSNLNINLNIKFKNIPANQSNWSSFNTNNINNNNKNYSNNDEVYNSFYNSQNKNFLYNNDNNNLNHQTVKLSTTLTMPNLGLNRNLISNNNKTNYNIANTNAKIKLMKTDASIKLIPKQDPENKNNLKENSISNSNSNHDFSDNSSARNLELKKTSTTNTNINSTNVHLNNNLSNSNNKSNIKNNNNNKNNNSFENQSSSNKSNIDKSTTARILNNQNTLLTSKNLNNTNLNINLNSNSNSTSQNNASVKEADSNSNSNSFSCCGDVTSKAAADKAKVFNNLYNSSHENNKDLLSNSILVQQLKIFDDSNIIESNLRLAFKLNQPKFLKRVAKGPPASFRWVSWLISSNTPFERVKDFYTYLLNQEVSVETDIQIKKDLNRTLSGIKISNFILDDTQLILYNILKAFAVVDNEVSYCQGMNFIVGFLLVISDFNELETFYFLLALFSYSFNESLGIRGFFLEGFPLLGFYVNLFLSLFSKNLTELQKHFEKLEIPDEVWISKWFRTLFTLSLPFDFCMRIWDCLVIHGLEFLLCFTLALMKNLEPELLKKQDLFEVIEFFKKMSPFFAIENEGEDALIAESVRFIEAFNIEEIILNAKKIKISPVLVQEQIKIYEKTHKVSFEKLKVKYNLSFGKNENENGNENSSNFHYCEESNFNVEEELRRSSIVNNNIGNFNVDSNNKNKIYNNRNQNHFNNFCDYNNNNYNYDNEISLYSLQAEKRNNCDFYINTDTCRSEIEKIKNNLKQKNSNLQLHSSTTLNLNSSNNNLQVYLENDLQKLQSSESTKKIGTNINNNINIKENEIINNSLNNKNQNSKFDHNCSAEIEQLSPTNSDTDLNEEDIRDKIKNYTFKAKSNVNANLRRFEFNNNGGKID